MPTSYREPDHHTDDIVIFDYAKSVEARRRPLPWLWLAKQGALAAPPCFVLILVQTGSFICAIGFACAVVVLQVLLIPWIRDRRGLSGDHFTSARRPGTSKRLC